MRHLMVKTWTLLHPFTFYFFFTPPPTLEVSASRGAAAGAPLRRFTEVRECLAKASGAAAYNVDVTIPFSSYLRPKLRELFGRYYPPLTGFLMSGLDSKERKEMLGAMLTVLVRHGYQDAKAAAEFFQHAQSMGFHVLPDHFYSPIPNTARLTEEVWTRRFDEIPGWDLNVTGQLELLGKLASWADEMKDTPSKQVSESGYFWTNSQFNSTDAAFYHSMIRMAQPKQVLEIGAGYSTMVSTRAAGFNKDTRVRCIEPYPMAALKNGMPGLDELIHLPLQSVPVSEFESLQPNDILFVDSTHVGKIDSDVNYIFFHILPRLRAGVIVHFHDIFLPNDYPRGWVVDHRLFWNEQYFLLAFLLFNPRVEVMLAAHYLGMEHAAAIASAFPYLPTFGGCSFWLRFI